MNTTNKLTITLSPEEVQEAISFYVTRRRLPQDKPHGYLEITFNFSEYACEMSGATVEVTQP